MKYILIAQENIHHDIKELNFESEILLTELLHSKEIRELLDNNGIEDNNDEVWEHRKNDMGFKFDKVDGIPSISSQSEDDYSHKFIIQEDKETQQQKNNLELYVRRSY